MFPLHCKPPWCTIHIDQNDVLYIHHIWTGKLPQTSGKLPNPKFYFIFGFWMMKGFEKCQGPFWAWPRFHLIDDHTYGRSEKNLFLNFQNFLLPIERASHDKKIIIKHHLLFLLPFWRYINSKVVLLLL